MLVLLVLSGSLSSGVVDLLLILAAAASTDDRPSTKGMYDA
jgi:hypothetical protein